MAARTSRRAPKRHVQQRLFRRGGRRKGAGRKPKGLRAGTSHQARPTVKPQYPMHVTLRVVSEVGSMRKRAMYKAVRDATVVAAVRERIRIVHASIQRTHIHLLVEADDNRALARGMQGLQISIARNVNTVLGDGVRRRRGKVFADRYHLEVITSPRQARHSLAYTLSNWRRHKEDQHGLARTWLVDPFSSGISFPDWEELADKDLMWPIRETYDPLVVRRPASWLLRDGWKRAGSISARSVPGPRGGHSAASGRRSCSANSSAPQARRGDRQLVALRAQKTLARAASPGPSRCPRCWGRCGRCGRCGC